jgi:hypothetical protein
MKHYSFCGILIICTQVSVQPFTSLFTYVRLPIPVRTRVLLTLIYAYAYIPINFIIIINIDYYINSINKSYQILFRYYIVFKTMIFYDYVLFILCKDIISQVSVTAAGLGHTAAKLEGGLSK